jgi:hypothetical protein
MANLWRALEATPDLVAVPAVWRQRTGPDFAAACAGFLRPTGRPAQSYPCDCGCSHDIIRHSAEHIVAICQCDPWTCDDIRLTPEEATLWELSRIRLGRAICRALDIDARESEFDPEGTAQIGAFSARALPVYLTIPRGSEEFQHTVAKLAARLSDGFILLAPTSRYVDGECREFLVKARAGFFDLESNFTLLPSGLLHARRRAGELFAAFTTAGAVIIEETARQAFAIVKALDSEKPQRDASLLTVFRLYCIEGLSAEATAQRCGCSKATILNRLSQMEQRIGTSPASLRTYSAQFQAIEETLSDPRARRIRRQEALDGLESDDE